MRRVEKINVDAFKHTVVQLDGVTTTVGERWPNEPMRCPQCRAPIDGDSEMVIEIDTTVESVDTDGPLEREPIVAGYLLSPCGHNRPPYWAPPGTPALELDVTLR